MMRLFHLLGFVLVVGVLNSAYGQAPRFEIGGFGTYTRYEDAVGLDDRIGGGARIAFHLNKVIALELGGAYLGPSDLAGNASGLFHLASASLLLGTGSRAFSVYATGGYSRLEMGSIAPFDYTETGYHAGAGLRIGLGERLAIRAEGLAMIMPDDDLTGQSSTHIIASAGLSFFTSPWNRAPTTTSQPPVEPVAQAPSEPQPSEAAPAPEGPVDIVGVPAAEPGAAPAAAAAATRRARSQTRRTARFFPHAEQIEVSPYASYTRYDQMFGLENQVGGGLRLGYFLSDRWNLELEGAYSSPSDSAGTVSTTLSTFSGSLGYNFRAGRHSFYLLGGYTRASWNEGPYDFGDNMVHGGAGLRLFFTNSIALRLEGRALYAWNTDGPPPWAGHVIGSAGLTFLASPPRQTGQGGIGGRAYQWYWGGQGGVFFYKTNLQPYYYEPVVGGHWMITAKRTALYLGYEQAFFISEAQAAIFDPSAEATGQVRTVAFSDMRRILFGVLTHPSQKVIEPLAGLGFALVQVLDPRPDCTADCETSSKTEEAFARAEDAASRAFFWIMGGIQMNYSNRLNVFGHYILTSSSRGYLIDGNTHTIQGGIRYSFGTSKEGLTERN
jgi:hypothetical protein